MGRAIVYGVVILAAGASSRMGRAKLLLKWGHTSVVGHLIDQWRQLEAKQIAVVHAGRDQAINTELNRLGFPEQDRIGNLEPERGMFSSIQSAARWPGWDASLSHWAIVLGDQPHLKDTTLLTLIRFSAEHAECVCQPASHGRRRHPVILPKQLFTRLATSQVPSLKQFLAEEPVACCECDDPGLDLDMDRPEDYERALALAGLKQNQSS